MQLDTDGPCLLVLFLQTFNRKPSEGLFSKAFRLALLLSITFSMSFENFSVYSDTTNIF
jgi:hypothetical protein